MLSDWVLYRLAGRFVTDPSSGSSSDLFDLRGRTWSPTIARDRRPRRRRCPQVLEPGTVVGAGDAAAAGETGPGGRHAGRRRRRRHAARAASASASPGRAADPRRRQLLAAHGGHRRAADRPEARVCGRCATRCPGLWMTEGIGFYCGIAMRWFRDAFCELETREAARARRRYRTSVMEEAAAPVPAGSNGVARHLLQRDGRQALGPGVAVLPADSTSIGRRTRTGARASVRSRSRRPTPRVATSRSSPS